MRERATPVFTTYEQLREHCAPVDGSSGCLRWRAQRNPDRYPYIFQPERNNLTANWSEKMVLAHKLAYDLKYGLREGRQLRRIRDCVLRGCMNPDHYELW